MADPSANDAALKSRPTAAEAPFGAARGTISAGLVEEALRDLPKRNADPLSLLRQAGLSAEMIADPNGRVPVSLYAELWRTISLATDDEFFGMNAKPLPYGSFRFISRAARDCPDAKTALLRILNFFALILDDMTGRLTVEDGLAIMTLKDAPPGLRAFTAFTFWLVVDGLLCWLAGRRIPLLAIDVTAPRPPDIHCADYRTLFTEELRFSQPENRLIFEARFLDLPIRRTRAQLRTFLRNAPSNILVRYRDPSGLSTKVKQRLRDQGFEDWPTLEQIAKAFRMSPATFYRHLEGEGHTYQELKNAVRRDMAVRQLCDTSQSIAQIAEQAGFADTSSFFRAFRKWTGLNPGDYRARVRPQKIS